MINKLYDILFIAVSKNRIRCSECGSCDIDMTISDVELCLQCKRCDTLLLMAQSRV